MTREVFLGSPSRLQGFDRAGDRAAVLGDAPLWDDEWFEVDDRQRALIEALCSLVGVTPAPMLIG